MVSFAAALLLGVGALGPCFGLGGSQGPVIRPYAPIGLYAGHWGVDIGLPIGSEVRALGPGIVTFAGTVADRRSVTVAHGSSVRTSYSYLSEVSASVGDRVGSFESVGTSGVHDGTPSFHLSLRVNGTYTDPVAALACRPVASIGLFLAPRLEPYALNRARNSRRYFRSTSRGPPCGRALRP